MDTENIMFQHAMYDLAREEDREEEDIENLERQNHKDKILLEETKSPKLKAQLKADIEWRNQKIAEKKSRAKFLNGMSWFGLIFQFGLLVASIIFFFWITHKY